jgi:hypothetical protein
LLKFVVRSAMPPPTSPPRTHLQPIPQIEPHPLGNIVLRETLFLPIRPIVFSLDWNFLQKQREDGVPAIAVGE